MKFDLVNRFGSSFFAPGGSLGCWPCILIAHPATDGFFSRCLRNCLNSEKLRIWTGKVPEPKRIIFKNIREPGLMHLRGLQLA